MEVMLLGTAAAEAFPGIFCRCETCKKARQKGGRNIRARHSVLIDQTLQIDFGNDMFMNLARFNVDFTQVQHLLITHDHADHLSPEDLATRGPGFIVENLPPLVIYGNAAVGRRLESAIESCKGRLVFKEIHAGDVFMAGDYEVHALTAKHDPRQECLMYIVCKDGKSVLYGNDSGEYPEKFWQETQGLTLNLAMMDCTSGAIRADYGSHMGFPQNLEMKEKMLACGLADENTRFLSTHFSHNGRADYDDMVELARGTGFDISYDGMKIQL